MQKKLSYLILLTLIVIIPINAKALTGSINISCDKEIYKVGDTATCNVTGTSDVDVYSISAKINNISSSNTTIEFETDSSWQGNGEEGNVQLYTDSGKKGTFNIGKLNIKLNDTTTGESTIKVSIDDIKYGDTNGSEYDIEPIQKSISFTPSLIEDNENGENSITTPNTTTVSNKTNVSNPKTADIKIMTIVLLIMALGSLIVLGTKNVRKNKQK